MRRRNVSKDPRSDAERVARAIDVAIERINERDPILGRILRETIETGDYFPIRPILSAQLNLRSSDDYIAWNAGTRGAAFQVRDESMSHAASHYVSQFFTP